MTCSSGDMSSAASSGARPSRSSTEATWGSTQEGPSTTTPSGRSLPPFHVAQGQQVGHAARRLVADVVIAVGQQLPEEVQHQGPLGLGQGRGT